MNRGAIKVILYNVKVRYVLELPLEYPRPIMLLPWRYYEHLKNSQSSTFAHRIGVAVPDSGNWHESYTQLARGPLGKSIGRKSSCMLH